MKEFGTWNTTFKWRINLKTWFRIDRNLVRPKRPKNCQKVWIIDSDDYGYAEYKMAAIYCLGYFVVKNSGVILGATHWKPRNR